MHPDDIEQTLALTLAGGRPCGAVRELHQPLPPSGRVVAFAAARSARSDGEVWYAAAKDVTDRMWLERQALHDPLTKLPNRLLLMDRAHQALTRLRRSNGPNALLFIDLDGFKAINDNLGHAVGDHLLISVAERLAEMLRDSDTVARLGGDEFVVLAEDLQSDAETLAVAERVLHALQEPFVVGSAEVSMLASVGVSVSHDCEANPEDLLREADVAMYQAKGSGADITWSCSTRIYAEEVNARAWNWKAPPWPCAASPRAAARVPAVAGAERRQADRLRGARALASPRR